MGKINAGRRVSRRMVLKSTAALAGAAAASTGWTRSLFAAPSRTMKLGLVTPQTGPLASFAEADGFVVEALCGRHLDHGRVLAADLRQLDLAIRERHRAISGRRMVTMSWCGSAAPLWMSRPGP